MLVNWSELHILTELLVISMSSYQCHNKCPKPLTVYTHANKFHQVLVFFLQNYKMIESWVCSWEYFHYSWMNLITTHASQQSDSSKLSKFVLLLIYSSLEQIIHWRHSNNLLEVYLAITSTISYLDKVPNLNYQKQYAEQKN